MANLNKIIAERLAIAFGNDTQETVRRKLNMTQGNVSKLVNGNQMPTVDTLLDVSKAYKVSVDWLMGISDNPEIDGLVVEKLTYEQVAKVLETLLQNGTIELPNMVDVAEQYKLPEENEMDETTGEDIDDEESEEETAARPPIYDSDHIKIKDRLLSYIMRRRLKLSEIDLEMLDVWRDKLGNYQGLKLLNNTEIMQETIDAHRTAVFKDGDWVALIQRLSELSEAELQAIVNQIKEKEGTD